MGSLSSHGLKGRIGLEWSQEQTPSGQIIKNNFSQQQFHLHSIANIPLNNPKLYFMREFSSLPKTPKIICLERQSENLLILVQKGAKCISLWLSQIHCQLSILLKLKDLITAINALKNKFGPFLVTQKMVKVTSNDNLIVWYNEKFESNIVQLPLGPQDKNIENQTVMINNICQIFRKSNCTTFCINLLIPDVKSFVQFKQKVKQRIQQIEYPFNQKTYSQQCIGIYQRNSCLTSQKHTTNKSISFSIPNSEPSKKRTSLELSSQKSNRPIQRRKISFLDEYINGDNAVIGQSKRNKLSSLDEQSSQNYSSSNSESRQNRGQSHKELGSKQYKSLNSLFDESKTMVVDKEKNGFRRIFKKKDTKYSNFQVIQGQDKLEGLTMEQPRSLIQPRSNLQTSKHVQFQAIQYKAYDSFSSKKKISLTSTAGTLQRTRQFLSDNLKQLLKQNQQTIKQQSDQTHKNSNNYSIEESQQQLIKESVMLKEDVKQDMQASVSLSTDFNNLFSARGSIVSGMEDSMREKEFEKILFGTGQ